MKLFEIPVYAFDKATLVLNVKNHAEKIRASIKDKTPNELFIQAEEIETKDQRVYEYNHIVGFIVIIADETDIMIKVYISTKKRYHWKSRKKTFLRDSMANGLHFRHVDMNNDMIIEKLYKNVIVASKFFRNRFIDKESFLNIYDKLDYKIILSKE